MGKDVIVALDFDGVDKALDFLKPFNSSMYVKVGMELYYRGGPEIVKKIKSMGHKVFLDLKLHDIPNTVYGGIRSIVETEADMINIHIAGGSEMIQAADRARQGSNSLLLGITVLTSLNDEILHQEVLIDNSYSLDDVVLNYATLGKENGLDGIVCSALESKKIKEALGKDFLTICPGIRPASFAKDDQTRIVTPSQAREELVDYIVVGRPITKSEDPVAAYKSIVKEFVGE